MAALDFPSSPTLNQMYVGTNGVTYTWDGGTWTAGTVTAAGITVAATAPAAPVQGQLWWRNDPDGNLYMSYNDGNSTQWVPAVPSSTSPWKVSGSTLTPVDATKTVTVVGASPNTKFRMWQHSNRTSYLTNNLDVGANTQDDATSSSWGLQLGAGGGDNFKVRRAAAGTTTLTDLLTLDNAGNLSSQPPSSGTTTFHYIYGQGPYGGQLEGRQCRGTVTAPTATQLNDVVAQVGAAGYGTAWAQQGVMLFKAAENWTGAARGLLCKILLTPNGSTGMSSEFWFDHNGNYVISGSVGQKSTGTTWSNPSDIRLKKDVAPYAHGLADILQLEPISYTLKATDQQTCGLDAEKVRAVFPECVGTTRMKLRPEDEEETEVLTLDIHPILIALINAVKELAGRN
jgi:Chaperone of endosialidase